MATMVTRSAPFLAPPSLSGAARLLLPQRGAGPLRSAVRAASSLETAMGNRTRPMPPPWPASRNTP